MKRTLFHGSEKLIVNPQASYSNARNDFGKGLYCTEDLELAKEWACKNDKNGFANEYVVDWTGLKICNLNSKEYNILNWLALLTRYRSYWQRKSIAEQAKIFLQDNYLIDIDPFDVIIGNRADDSYFSFAQDFIMGTISLQKLARAMNLGKLGEQIVLKSEKAFESIEYVDNQVALKEEYYTKKMQRDILARRDYQDTKNATDYLDDIFIVDIMRGRVKDSDLRI